MAAADGARVSVATALELATATTATVASEVMVLLASQLLLRRRAGSVRDAELLASISIEDTCAVGSFIATPSSVDALFTTIAVALARPAATAAAAS